MGIAGRLYTTEGIAFLPPEDQSAIREKVERFADFSPDNDPHGEHDFGAFKHDGRKVFWKIDTTTGPWTAAATSQAIRSGRPAS